MTLADWLQENGRGSLTRLMRETGLAYTTIYNARDGGPKKVGIETARRIESATGGEVTAAEILGLEDSAA